MILEIRRFREQCAFNFVLEHIRIDDIHSDDELNAACE